MIISMQQAASTILLFTTLGGSTFATSPVTYCADSSALYYYKGDVLGEEQQKSYSRLDELASYKADWNGNGADPFSPELISKCKSIINELSRQPEIYPTAIDAIQFEYDKDDGSYIEFEVYLDKAKMYRKDASGNGYTRTISLSEIKKEVDAFYESK